MAEDPTASGNLKPRFRVWLPIVATVLGVVLGRYVGRYTLSAWGIQVPTVPARVPRSLYDGTMSGGIYGGVGACVAAVVVGVASRRWSGWLALAVSLLGGVLLAAVGAMLET